MDFKADLVIFDVCDYLRNELSIIINHIIIINCQLCCQSRFEEMFDFCNPALFKAFNNACCKTT